MTSRSCQITKMFLHIKCRNKLYSRDKSSILRFPVPDDKVSWEEPFLEYQPTSYTADVVSRCPVWADKVCMKIFLSLNAHILHNFFKGFDKHHKVFMEYFGRKHRQKKPRGQLQTRQSRLPIESPWEDGNQWPGLSRALGTKPCCRSNSHQMEKGFK